MRIIPHRRQHSGLEQAIRSKLLKLWPWLVASGAIHGLVFVLLAVQEPPSLQSEKGAGDMRVSVELLGETAQHRVVQPHQPEQQKVVQQKEHPVAMLHTKQAVVPAIVQKPASTPNMAFNADSSEHAVASAASQVSSRRLASDQINSMVRKHLEHFKYYPASARRRGIEGEVDVAFTLAMNGHADEVSILHGSGYAVLDRAALDTVQRAQPFPADGGYYRFRLRFSRL